MANCVPTWRNSPALVSATKLASACAPGGMSTYISPRSSRTAFAEITSNFESGARRTLPPPRSASSEPPRASKSPPERRVLPTPTGVPRHSACSSMTPAASVRASDGERFADGRPFHPELPRSDQRQHCAGGDGRARNPQAARRPTYLRAPLRFGGAPNARQRLGRERRHLQVAAQDFFVVDVAHVTSPTAACCCCHSARNAWRALTNCDSAALSETCSTRAISGTVSSSPNRSSSMRA